MASLSDLKVGDPVEVTHHMTFNRCWFPAKVTKVTAHFVDVLRDDWSTSKPTRYRKSDGRVVTGYCGFYSSVRLPQAATVPPKATP